MLRCPIASRPIPGRRCGSTHSQTRRSVICDIVDVGPWNIDDPYWERGARPQAETGTDMMGRRTNAAGIDLTPAAAQAIGLAGKGKVEWEFMSGVASGPVISGGGIVVPTTPSPGTPAPTPRPDLVAGLFAQFFRRLQNKPQGAPMPTSENDLGAVLQQAMKVLQNVEQQRAAGDATATPQQQAEQISAGYPAGRHDRPGARQVAGAGSGERRAGRRRSASCSTARRP